MKLAFAFVNSNCTMVEAEGEAVPLDESFEMLPRAAKPHFLLKQSDVNLVNYVSYAAIIAAMTLTIDFSLF